MANQISSTHRRPYKDKDRRRVTARAGVRGGQQHAPDSVEFCSVCFLTFGSQETKVLKGGRAAHPQCVQSRHTL